MSKQNDWDILLAQARQVLRPRQLSPFVEAGGVAAALLTRQGSIYLGVCIDSACSLGMCAERSAIASMVTHGENQVEKLVCVMGDGSLGYPCGACRELLLQLDYGNKDLLILTEESPCAAVRLEELMPHWWGWERYIAQNNR